MDKRLFFCIIIVVNKIYKNQKIYIFDTNSEIIIIICTLYSLKIKNSFQPKKLNWKITRRISFSIIIILVVGQRIECLIVIGLTEANLIRNRRGNRLILKLEAMWRTLSILSLHEYLQVRLIILFHHTRLLQLLIRHLIQCRILILRTFNKQNSLACNNTLQKSNQINLIPNT